MKRLLLPFTSSIEMDVLETLVLLAAEQSATLVPLSLIVQPFTPRKYVRPELLHQSNDFLEAVRHKAAQHRLTVEAHELFTRDVEVSISQAIRQFRCDGILLASRGRRGCLLPLEIIERLLAKKPCSLLLTHFPPSTRDLWLQGLRARLGFWRAPEPVLPVPTPPVEQPPATSSLLAAWEADKEREIVLR